ncbi:MAG TPA: hypothetical protein VHY35_16975 [Stellaceae bacterium]|jgi:hypothetical protein|nr:hypothetical protein [Stellaceae bacterium]
MTRLICASCVALFIALIAFPAPSLAGGSVIHAKFSWEGTADCVSPSVHNLPIRIEGVGSLSVDRHASLDVTGSAMGFSAKTEHYEGTLGSRPVAAENGTAAVRVMGRHHLQAIRSYPNNSVIADLYVTGNQCVLKIAHRLKRGKRQYTFGSPFGGLAYCSLPRTTRTTCEPL